MIAGSLAALMRAAGKKFSLRSSSSRSRTTRASPDYYWPITDRMMVMPSQTWIGRSAPSTAGSCELRSGTRSPAGHQVEQPVAQVTGSRVSASK